MPSIKQNIVIDQGTTFFKTYPVMNSNNEPQDFSGYSAKAQLRKNYTSSNAVSFVAAVANGAISIGLTPSQTANMVPGRFVYDVLLTDAQGNVTRQVEGIAQVTPSVSK
jgi:hypothetical protein